ncbi:MAG: hypothetical protein IKW95_07775, partial [Lachnospiraceae bacterium]|nr:hypothetical protein [Lachnospiraceae bacterium]
IPRIFLNYTPEDGEKQQRKQRKRAKPEVSQTKTKAGVGTRSYFDNQLFFRFFVEKVRNPVIKCIYIGEKEMSRQF